MQSLKLLECLFYQESDNTSVNLSSAERSKIYRSLLQMVREEKHHNAMLDKLPHTQQSMSHGIVTTQNMENY
jgi:hypothetical protein